MTHDEKFMIHDILLEYCAKHECRDCNFNDEENRCKLISMLHELSRCEVE